MQLLSIFFYKGSYVMAKRPTCAIDVCVYCGWISGLGLPYKACKHVSQSGSLDNNYWFPGECEFACVCLLEKERESERKCLFAKG